MANKIVLTQIVKNESHVIERMLNSIKPIIDGICIVDTGSTDNTIELINKWGEENKIETYVFEKEFDNFENTRNLSFEKAREIFLNKKDGHTYYNIWLDADEQMMIDSTFKKEQLNKDLYMLNTYIGKMKYTRNELCRLDKPFRFYGPIHEFIVCDDQNITSGLVEGLSVNVQMDGHSWTSDISDKYKKHATVLEDYINNVNRDPRWIFYTAQSYHDSATLQNNRPENEERLRRAIKYYRERVNNGGGYPEEIFYSQYRIGSIMRTMECPWEETSTELLKAFSIDPLRAEPIKLMIDYYLSVGEWSLAYLYSKFSKINFHNRNPYPNRILFIDELLYKWKILEVHAAAAYYTGRIDEAKATYAELLDVLKNSPEYFTDSDISKINMNGQFLK